MPNETADFASILRRLTCRDGVAALLAALGFGPCADGAWSSLGTLPDAPGLRGIERAGERPGAVAWLIQVEGDPVAATLAPLARRLRDLDVSRHSLFLAADAGFRRIALACFGLEGELRHLGIERAHVRATDVDTLREMAAVDGEGGIALAVRQAAALDRARITRRFFDDFRDHRERVAYAWTGLPAGAAAERAQLALLFLCRLMFLYFLQRRGHLAGDPAYLAALIFRRARERARRTVFRRAIVPLFFGALNTRPERRTAAARALGELPYLNGGLFERHALERRHPELDLPDDVLLAVVRDFLERYRFTTRDSAEDLLDGAADTGVDPEMLGRVFEGMMSGDRRGDTGTFYTPAAVVDRLVASALAARIAAGTGIPPERALALVREGDAASLDPVHRARLTGLLASMRVLDPACGSGAFLLGALSRLTRLRQRLTEGDAAGLRREIVGRSLHGVDLQGDAALLCALRLWLALAVEADRDGSPVPPLPNLDRRVRQGDALLDPLELGSGDTRLPPDPAVRRAQRSLAPAAERYLTAGPEEKESLRRALAAGEAELARAWVAAAARRLDHRAAELASLAASRDLWGAPTDEALRAHQERAAVAERREEVARLEGALVDDGALPFFSFGVHFADAAGSGFDLILSNPPWVRAHRWSGAARRMVREHYAVCREPGWRTGARLAGMPGAAGAQVDLSLLFLERSLALLATDGAIGLLLPAKAFRSLYGGRARRMLIRETRITAVEDHSLDQRSIFQADAFAGVVVAVRRPPYGSATADGVAGGSAVLGSTEGRGTAAPDANGDVDVTLVRRRVAPQRFRVPQADLPLFPEEPDAPWLLAPPDVRAALRAMQRAGAPLASHAGLRVRRGVLTGANDVLVVREVRPRLGDLASIRAQGWFATGRRRPAAKRGEAARYATLVEASALRPLVRGADIDAWTFEQSAYIVWVHDAAGTPREPPPRMRRYLARHEETLRRRSGARANGIPGAIFRLHETTLGPKVAWHDLADTLRAVALPATVRSPLGLEQPLVPLNTVYFMPAPDRERAMLIAAYLNALPVRTFARAIAERAKDAHFRFFAWTVGVLPLPSDWATHRSARRLLAISKDAHEAGGIEPAAQEELDAIVAARFRLSPAHIGALAGYDRWLRGVAE